MYTLTEKRLEEAKPILNEFRDRLHSEGSIDALDFERRLIEGLGCGKVDFKEVSKQLLKTDEYLYLAAYHMENSNGPRDLVALEFKTSLAKIYGVDIYGSEGMEEARERFWDGMHK